jgi:hypothetical protein
MESRNVFLWAWYGTFGFHKGGEITATTTTTTTTTLYSSSSSYYYYCFSLFVTGMVDIMKEHYFN